MYVHVSLYTVGLPALPVWSDEISKVKGLGLRGLPGPAEGDVDHDSLRAELRFDVARRGGECR